MYSSINNVTSYSLKKIKRNFYIKSLNKKTMEINRFKSLTLLFQLLTNYLSNHLIRVYKINLLIIVLQTGKSPPISHRHTIYTQSKGIFKGIEKDLI